MIAAICVVILLLAAFCFWYFYHHYLEAPQAATEEISARPEGTPVEGDETERDMALTYKKAEEEAEEENPVDFEALQAMNPDIYGWIYIEDTVIDYPIVQNAENDSYYLWYNPERVYSVNGSLFTEHVYNSKNFEDPVTVIYGHHLNNNSGLMFTDLQANYSDEEFFESHEDIVIYEPEGKKIYKVFAALPYSGDHLLYYNDFTDQHSFEAFFERVFSVRASTLFSTSSTRLNGAIKLLFFLPALSSDNTYRYLVMATLQEAETDAPEEIPETEESVLSAVS